MTDPLARMTVLIAGAGSGMGRATAVAAASAGARTLLLGRTRPGLEVTEAAVPRGRAPLRQFSSPMPPIPPRSRRRSRRSSSPASTCW